MTNYSGFLMLIISAKGYTSYLYMIGHHCTSLIKSISKMLVESLDHLVLSNMRYVATV